MTRYRRFALLAVLSTYFLIFVGGLVRVAGAGLGCPDWPKCFGRWIPPLSADQLPAEIDPRLFNFALAWIEYVNRLIGVFIGIVILITAYFAIRDHLKEKSISIPAILSLVLVLVQAWLGGQVVISGLAPYMVSIHLALAFIIVSLLLFSYQQATVIELAIIPRPQVAAIIKIAVIGLWLLYIVQIFLGTRVRESLEHMETLYPLLSPAVWLDRIDSIHHLHMGSGILTAFLTWLIAFIILQQIASAHSSLKTYSWSLIMLVFVQIVIGFTLSFAGLPSIARLLHLWVASLLFGNLVLIYGIVRRA